jgi:hypothetical protein
MLTWYVLQHDYCCNQNCCCIVVSYLPWQPQLLCCIFVQLHNNCTCFVCIFLQTSSTRLCTLSARECYTMDNQGIQSWAIPQILRWVGRFQDFSTPNTTVSPFLQRIPVTILSCTISFFSSNGSQHVSFFSSTDPCPALFPDTICALSL